MPDGFKEKLRIINLWMSLSPAGLVCRQPTGNSCALFCRGPPRSPRSYWTLPPLPPSWSEVLVRLKERGGATELTSGWSSTSIRCTCLSRPWCMPRLTHLPQAVVHLSWYQHTLKFRVFSFILTRSWVSFLAHLTEIQKHNENLSGYKTVLLIEHSTYLSSFWELGFKQTWQETPFRNSESSRHEAVLGDCVLCRPSLVVKALNLLEVLK